MKKSMSLGDPHWKEVQDIPEGKTVLIYWVPDPNKEGELFARKIDAIMSEEEFDAKYGTGE